MTPLDILQDLGSRGVVLTPRNGKLRVEAPAGVLTAQDRTLLVRHKDELLTLLASDLTLANLLPDWHLLWDERAAIREYDGGLPRERAEALALADIVGLIKQASIRCGARLPHE